MITWGDVVDIILYTFDLKQIELAILLECDPPKISKIRSGTQELSLPLRDKLFPLVFDPNKDNSPAQKLKGDPKFWLDRLKENIESQFKEVQKDMDDCWEGKDYQEFVLTMLKRARKGPSSIDCSKKKKGVSLGEPPTEQMSKIFEQAVADYSIATYVCKLPDYLLGEPFYASDIDAFTDAIKTDILSKFVNHQDENIFKKIFEFSLAIESYSAFLGMIRLSISEKYGCLLRLAGFNCEIIKLIDDEKNEITNKCEGKNLTEESVNNPSAFELQGRLIQLDFIRNILLSHERLCKLFEDICPGKTILVFQ